MDRTTRRPDAVALIAGLLSLLVAVLGITGSDLLTVVDLRWVLAGAAVLAGIAFLVASLRHARRQD
ncbi:hypothetical protein WIS52_09130 [Pseudonocardia nematodicida]|uniref:Uncharacterized protein n=1 Tax=Pseudonocardia nematodicida TaxID=1206997 RepID=A0ABV1K819_9PSEU